MKRTLDHLPAIKREQLEAVVKLICESAEVEMIILFGSHARGDYVDDPVGNYFSDYDIVVVVKNETIVENHNLWSSIGNKAERLTGRNQPNLIVHDIKDVNYQLEQGWYFFTDVKKEGIILYNSGRYQLAEAKPKAIEQRRAYAQQCFDYFFTRATRFFSTAIDHIKKSWNNDAAFQLHQATESYYKCALLVLTSYRPKQHNIDTLGKQCVNANPAFRGIFPRDTPADRRRFDLLKAAYVDARYSLNYSISQSDLEELARNVSVLHEHTEAICKEHIASMGSNPEGSE